MAQAFASIAISAPADKVWLPYAPSSETTEGGRVRHVANPNGETIVERLEKLDNAARSYSYSIIQAPFSVTDYLSTISVHEKVGESGCLVEWLGTFIAKGVSDSEASKLFQGIFEDGL